MSFGFIDYVAIIALTISSYVYIAVTPEKGLIKNADFFFFNAHGSKSKVFGASMAAASTSLATVIIFFIAGVQQYGIFLIWCGLSYLAGQILFLHIASKAKLQTSSMTTIADFFHETFGGRYTAMCISILGLLAFILILFLELFIGAQILEYYLPYQWFSSTLAFMLLLSVVAVYVYRGGIQAVLKSDVWQYSLMIIAIACLFFVAIFDFNFEGDWQNKVITRGGFSGPNKLELIFFLIWVTIQNLTIPFTQLSSWQRLAATASVEEARKGIHLVMKGFLLLWLLPVAAFLIMKINGDDFNNVSMLFDYLRSSDSLLVYFSYALVFVGFSSALFSTADSAMIACFLSVNDKNTFRPLFASGTVTNKKTVGISLIAGLMLLELLLHAVFKSQAGSEFLSVVYLIFSSLAIFSPHIIFAFVHRIKGGAPGKFTRAGDGIIAVGLLSAVCVLFYINSVGPSLGMSQTLSTLVGSFVSISISALFLCMARLFFFDNRLTGDLQYG